MPIQLPSDTRLDPWRLCGWADPLPPVSQTLSAGVLELDTAQRWGLSGQHVVGLTDADGYPLTTLRITKSLYRAFGQGTKGGQYGYSWGDGWLFGTHAVLRNLIIEFPDQPSPTHFYGRGWNALSLWSSYVENVHIVNADNGIFLQGSHSEARNCTLQARDTDHDGLERAGLSGHYGFKSTGDDCAYVNCRVLNTKFQHDFSVEKALRTAFIDCSGVDSNFDHHANKEMNSYTLWYRMKVGRGTRIMASGGNPIYLPHRHDHSYFVDTRYGSGTLVPSGVFPNWPYKQVWSLSSPPTPPPAPKFVVGQSVTATAQVNVRQAPGTNKPLLGTQPTGAIGTVLQGPVPATGYIYWEIQFPTLKGWVGEDKLR